MVGAEPRGGLALAMESTEKEKEEEGEGEEVKEEEEKEEEEREEMLPFTTCPLHHCRAIGHKTVSRILVGLVTDDK